MTLDPTPKLGARRKGVSVTEATLVTQQPLFPERTLPWLVQPAVQGVDLEAFCRAHRPALTQRLHEHGAVLFRGFAVETAEHFERIIAALSEGALEYMFRASPRTRVGGNIYTSTDYPADQVIFPHNEHSYSPRFPLKLFFYCHQPSVSGGETPIGATHDVLRSIPAEIRERFRSKRVRYVRNYGDGFGLPWQTVFQTSDRSEVDAYCASVGIQTVWKSADRLRTIQTGPAIVRHPDTGEEVWFNHATFFHVSTLPEEVQRSLRESFGPEDLPTNTFYGDGSEIEPDVLEQLRDAYRAALVRFRWQKSDVLFIDNMLSVHGREAYVGDRSILTGMAEARLAANLDTDPSSPGGASLPPSAAIPCPFGGSSCA